MGRQSSFEVWMIGLSEGWLDLPCWRKKIYLEAIEKLLKDLKFTLRVPQDVKQKL